MFEHDALRQTLETQALSAAAEVGLTLAMDNSEYVQPEDGSLWAEWWIRTTTTKSKEVAGPRGYECTPGIMQFTLKAPEEQGNGALILAGGKLKKLFNCKQFVVAPDGYVTFDPISVETHGKSVGGFFNVIVWATFDFHHHDPDADTMWTRS